MRTAGTLLGIEKKTALVSGSTRGIGRAVAAALAGAGAKVAINYLKDERTAGDTLSELKALDADAVAIRADVSRRAEALRFVRKAESALGDIDILVNCAHGRITRTGFVASGWQEHQRHMYGILKAAFNLSQAVIGGMKKRGWGRVVSVGSNMVGSPVTGYSAYTSAMASLIGFTRNLALEAGPSGTTVNMVSAGFVLTEDTPHTNEAVRKAIAGSTPMGRLATPDDIAGAVLFFCSGLARFVTGANLPVDGGRVMS